MDIFAMLLLRFIIFIIIIIIIIIFLEEFATFRIFTQYFT
jgi:hypothetical protein